MLSPPLISAPEEAEDSSSPSYEGDSSRLPSVARISLEVMGGAAGGALSALMVYYTAELVFGRCLASTGCEIVYSSASVGGILLGTPSAVYLVGHLAGGRGSYWTTLLGMAVGSGAGIGMAVALNDRSEALQYASLVMLPLIGSVAGYEIWHAYRQPDSTGLARANAAGALPQIIPMLGFTPAGGVFGGLAARF